eukprot:403358183
MIGYPDLSPTSKLGIDQKLKNLYEVIRKKKGILTNDDDDMIIVKNAFKDIPVTASTPKPVEVDTFEDQLDLNQMRFRKQTVVAPRQLNQRQKSIENSPAGKDTKNQGQTPNEESQAPVTPAWKKNEDIKIIQVCDCFGQYYSLTGSKWRPSFVMAIKDDTMILRTPVAKIDQMLNKINSSEQHKQLLSFLNQTIFGFDRISAAARDKVARCFVEKQFYPGQKLIKEGESQNSAFIIKEGECVLLSKQNPVDVKFTEDGQVYKKNIRGLQTLKEDRKKRGYMSKTTNQFKFGVKGKSQWVGEDILIFSGQETFYFSVVAVGKVTALEISRMDMISKLPQQFVKYLEKGSLKRKEFVLQRMKNINKTVKQIIKNGEDKEQFDDEYERQRHSNQQSQLIQQKIMSLNESQSNNKIGMKDTINLKINFESRSQLMGSVQKNKKNLKNYGLLELNELRKQSQSELGDINRKSLNLSQISGNLTQIGVDRSFSKHTQSIANISNADALELMTRNESVQGLYQASISQDRTNRKIALLNAKSLKPFQLHRRTEFVPVYYQKDPQKTRNFIANSIQMMKFQDDNNNNLESLNMSNIQLNQYDSSTQLNINDPIKHEDVYNFQQKALQPKIYQFSSPDQNLPQINQSISPIFKQKSQMRNYHTLDQKLKKEARVKYASFMLELSINSTTKQPVLVESKHSKQKHQSILLWYDGQKLKQFR